MSFRGRLTLFFALIVVVPMVAVTALLLGVSRDSRGGKADARLAGGLRTAITLYGDAVERSRAEARRVAGDRSLTSAIQRRSAGGVRVAVDRLAGSPGVASIVVLDARRRVLARKGDRDAVAAASISLRGADRALGSLRVSSMRALDYLDELRRLTDLNAALALEQGPPVSTLELGDRTVPVSGDVELPAGSYRARAVTLRAGGGSPARLTLFSRRASSGITGNQALIFLALGGFFAVAFVFTVMIMRAMQAEIDALLTAARRIGEGDFDQKVPVRGRDEFAGLAQEFNKMSERLNLQVSMLRRQREKLEESIRRVGDAFASGLDRDAVLQVVVETAVDACDADYGRAAVGKELLVRAESGARPPPPLLQAVADAESRSLAGRSVAHVDGEEEHALAHLLEISLETGLGRSLGVMTIARSGEAFSPADREMFHYLANQATVSIENVDLHELVTQQAVTDELTGLSNHRRFQEVIANEVERANRFEQELGLIMLDIDDFKKINDTYGHQQGDEVLRTVAQVLRRESRDVDEPARYGGEEMAVALPQTDMNGTFHVAERMRVALEAVEVPFVDREGALRITASFGVASLPATAFDSQGLIAAADAALYRAKRAGKNRTERASESVENP